MMKDVIDLHVHSTCSDGSGSPDELVRLARSAGLRAMALTDHDTIDGLEEAQKAADKAGVEFVNGIEVSAEYSPGTMHILGYLIDPECEKLRSRLSLLRNARDNRNPEIAARLGQLNIDISYAEVAEIAGGDVVGRPHFARVLLEKGYVASIQDAFDRYLAKGAAAYVEKLRLSPNEAIDLIHSSKGVAVLAHPYQLKCQSAHELGDLLDHLARLGLDGVEAIYSRHSAEDQARYADMARSRGLLITGGSDYHGSYKPDLSIGTGKGNLAVPYSLLEELRARARDHRGIARD